MQTQKVLGFIYILALGCLGALPGQGDPVTPPSSDSMAMTASSLKWQSGTITLPGDLATIHLTKDFHFLGQEDAQKVLHDLWGNPVDSQVLGMIFPANLGPIDPGSWGMTVEYEKEGYVRDDDAGKINYSDLLKQMQEQARSSSTEREKLGYPSIALVGWATPPHYDSATHKLYWAKDVHFGQDPGDTLNYNIRVLGRRGVLFLNAIAPMSQFPEIDGQMPNILSMVDFQAGNRYADFDPRVDKVATYGLATLIAGGALGAAAKLGLFKFLWPVLLAAKKFVVIGVVALGAFFKKIFARFSGKSSTPEHLLPPKS